MNKKIFLGFVVVFLMAFMLGGFVSAVDEQCEIINGVDVDNFKAICKEGQKIEEFGRVETLTNQDVVLSGGSELLGTGFELSPRMISSDVFIHEIFGGSFEVKFTLLEILEEEGELYASILVNIKLLEEEEIFDCSSCSENEICENNECVLIDTTIDEEEFESGECIDEDGEDPFVKSRTYLYHGTGVDDVCQDENFVTEAYCSEGKISRIGHYCPNGCKDGACVMGSENEEVGEKYEGEKKLIYCSGCELDGKCYGYGYRKGNLFCSNEGFISQVLDGEVCKNNFECEKNICIGSKCGEQGFFEKIISWFKRIFS